MSKTFKALQRAAQEREGKRQQEGKLLQPAEDQPLSSAAEDAAPATRSLQSETDESLRGEEDQALRNLLAETFLGPAGALRVEPDGWVRGRLDTERARQLLAKFSLLHCLQQDEDKSFWFWGSAASARERSRRSGLPLDLENLP